MTGISHDIANESPDAIARRLMTRAQTRDGLPEIAVGAWFLGLACFNGLPLALPHLHGPFAKAFVLGLMLAMITLPYGSRWLIKMVRNRFLIEKVGYVKLKPVNRRQRGIVFVTCFVVAGVSNWFFFKILGVHPDSTYGGLLSPAGLMLAGSGIVWGALVAFISRMTRYFIGGAVLAATGVFLAFSGVSLNVGFLILSGFIGLLSFVSGCVVLLLFLRQPAESAE